MDTWLVIVLIVLGAVLLLAAVSAVMLARRRAASRGQVVSDVEAADRALAAARAQDKGWDRERMESAARAAFAQQRPSAAVDALELIQVVDPPGTEEDKAIFRVRSDGGESRLTLGRHGDDWVYEALA